MPAVRLGIPGEIYSWWPGEITGNFLKLGASNIQDVPFKTSVERVAKVSVDENNTVWERKNTAFERIYLFHWPGRGLASLANLKVGLMIRNVNWAEGDF